MAEFSAISKMRLNGCDIRLHTLMTEVVKEFDCTIITGHRSEAEQMEAFNTGKSKLKYPQSKHNCSPSRAVDAAPWPIDWNDTKRFYFFAGYVKGVADRLGIKIRWGGDWDGDTEVKDNTFNDLVHFELK